MSDPIIKNELYWPSNLICDIKGHYVDIITLYHDGKVSYSDSIIQYPGKQMPDPDFKLLHLLFYVIFRQYLLL